jgi:hypothetical protein
MRLGRRGWRPGADGRRPFERCGSGAQVGDSSIFAAAQQDPAHDEPDDDHGEQTDLDHRAGEPVALVDVVPGRLHAQDDELLERCEDAGHQERLDDDLPLLERHAHGIEQLDEHEHQQQRVQHRDERLGAALVGCAGQLDRGSHEQHDGAGREHDGARDIDHVLGPGEQPVTEAHVWWWRGLLRDRPGHQPTVAGLARRRTRCSHRSRPVWTTKTSSQAARTSTTQCSPVRTRVNPMASG